MSEEAELQEALGASMGAVKWTFSPKKRVRVHNATVYPLANDPDATIIVCRCGWAVIMGPEVRLDEAERIFVSHA